MVRLRRKIGITLAVSLLFLCSFKSMGTGEVRSAYEAYQSRFAEIRTIEDISAKGYDVVEKHVFDVPLVSYMPDLSEDNELVPTEVVRPEDPYQIGQEDPVRLQQVATVRFFCATERENHRAAIFLADGNGIIIYKTNELECNYSVLGELNQPIYSLISVAFQDLNGDQLTDIILIAGCAKEEDGEKKTYKVGEVLFQDEATAASVQEAVQKSSLKFYRDWRINDKINRFDMNRSAKCIWSFVRDGRSTEFLYTATTADELMDEGFKPFEKQIYRRNYEKLGDLKVFPGVFSQGDNDIFMIYMIDAQGNIVWSFQPMGDYENLYALRGMSAADLDGDGMKDLLVVAKYSREGDDGELLVEGKYSVYYQRTGGFEEDLEFEKEHPYQAEQTVNELVNDIRAYWGWANAYELINIQVTD